MSESTEDTGGMNKTLILLAFLVLIALGIVGAVVLLILRPNELPQFIGAMTTLLGAGSTAVVLIYGLGKQARELSTIKRNTNGTLSAKEAEIARLRRLAADAGLDTTPPAAGSGVHRATESAVG